MKHRSLEKYGVFLVYGLAAALCVYAITGCAAPCPVDAPAKRLVDDYREFREDGLDEAETKILDHDAEAVDGALYEKSQPWTPPATGIPWLDAALALAGIATTVGASVKTVNWQRDRKRKQRGEPVT